MFIIPTLAQLDSVPRSPMDVADWWINKAATWGLSFVFLCCVLCILLYLAISLVGLAKCWIPKWFESSIESHERVAKAVDDLNETLVCIHEKTHSVHQGLKSINKGANSFVKRNKSKYDIGSEVLVHLDNAEDALEGGKNHIHRLQRREEEEGNDRNSSKPAAQ